MRRRAICRWFAAHFFACASAIGIRAHAGAVQSDRFDAYGHDLSSWSRAKTRAISPAGLLRLMRLYHVCHETKVMRQATTLATVLQHVQERVEQHQTVHAHVAALMRRTSFDPLVLLAGKFYLATCRNLPQDQVV